MLDGLALAYAEAQEEPYRTGVAGSCNTLQHLAPKCVSRMSPDPRVDKLHRTAPGNIATQMIASVRGDQVRIGALC